MELPKTISIKMGLNIGPIQRQFYCNYDSGFKYPALPSKPIRAVAGAVHWAERQRPGGDEGDRDVAVAVGRQHQNICGGQWPLRSVYKMGRRLAGECDTDLLETAVTHRRCDIDAGKHQW